MAKTVLYIIDPEKYFQGVISIFKERIKDQNVIYVTTNKPFNHVMNLLKHSGIQVDKIFFIDCISKTIGIDQQAENAVFVGSPQSLTSISIAVNESIKHSSGEKVLLLDSLSTLLVYNDAKTIVQFSNFLINKMRSADVETIILALESDINKEIVQQIESFADEVKKYGS